MKKVISLCLLSLVLLTGCNNTLTNSGTLNCSKTYTEDGDNVSEEMIVNYKNDMVTSVENITTTELSDATYIDMALSFGQTFADGFSTYDGIEMAYEKVNDNTIKLTVKVDYEKIDVNALKDAFGENLEDDAFYLNTNITLEDYKTEYLQDYTCK